MNRTVIVLLGVIAVETVFLGFLLVAFNARIDRIESATHVTHAKTASGPSSRNDLVLARF